MEELAKSSVEITPNDFSEEVLTQEEEAAALRLARESKHYARKLAEYQEKINAKDLWQYPNARELYEKLRDTMSLTGGKYQITDWNRKVVHDLCLYFARDAKFCDRGEGFSLDKGILLMGTPGSGKSHLMSFFTKNPNSSYAHITCKSIGEKYAEKWERDGMTTLEWYSKTLKAEFGHVYDQTELGYCFGDLGTEELKNSYGNKSNVMEHIIFERYENKLPFNQTHITTNLNPSEIEKFYGIRVRDRLREMTNAFTLKGDSFRH
jgi:DNA replication protein DnaC